MMVLLVVNVLDVIITANSAATAAGAVFLWVCDIRCAH